MQMNIYIKFIYIVIYVICRMFLDNFVKFKYVIYVWMMLLLFFG